MTTFKNIVLLVLGVCSITTAFPWSRVIRSQGACSAKRQRKPWQDLSDTERSDYLNATLCLMKAPPKSGIKGAQSRWDELHYVHVAQSDYIHFSGTFLPFHRYYLLVHENLMRNECGYKGPMPYWKEALDVGKMKKSIIFDPKTGFGGDGVNPTRCIADGPFANTVIHFTADLSTANYCIMRNLNECPFEGAAQDLLDACLEMKTYKDAWNCMEARPHAAGHAGVGGIMVNTKLSPADPIFFLHHSWLDRLYHTWQARDPAVRLTEMDGPNIPASTLPPFLSGPNATFVPPIDPACFLRELGLPMPNGTAAPATKSLAEAPPGGGGGVALPFAAPKPFPALTDYFNDGGNVTTLKHTLFSFGLLPNTTVGEVLDIGGAFVCTEYL